MTPNCIRVEKLGGFAGFGSSSHLRSEGQFDLNSLSPSDRAIVEDLLARASQPESGPVADRFRYRLTWTDAGQDHSVEVGEEQLPESVRQTVKDKLV